jgi:hypothetical protein
LRRVSSAIALQMGAADRDEFDSPEVTTEYFDDGCLFNLFCLSSRLELGGHGRGASVNDVDHRRRFALVGQQTRIVVVVVAASRRISTYNGNCASAAIDIDAACDCEASAVRRSVSRALRSIRYTWLFFFRYFSLRAAEQL